MDPAREDNHEVVSQEVTAIGASSLWIAYVARRLTRLVSVAVLVTPAYLMLLLLPGGPAKLSLGADTRPEHVLRRRAELGLDDSVPLPWGLSELRDVLSGRRQNARSSRMQMSFRWDGPITLSSFRDSRLVSLALLTLGRSACLSNCQGKNTLVTGSVFSRWEQ
ncbi:hypothetical protein [Arthrobacter sp. yr096]|uniref:hypothetical protein n=1 Tax=Arthrobacter sp. yr096 TaxID=1761750 RepID=UPI0035281972